jgi:hypothetical protein
MLVDKIIEAMTTPELLAAICRRWDDPGAACALAIIVDFNKRAIAANVCKQREAGRKRLRVVT